MAHTKYESLRNLSERYEGYGNSIRRVMEARTQISGVRGVVADLIDVPKEYETAVETALGGSIQNIVTDTEQTAKRLIEYLKKNRYGRATFLPLNAVSGREEGFSLPDPFGAGGSWAGFQLGAGQGGISRTGPLSFGPCFGGGSCGSRYRPRGEIPSYAAAGDPGGGSCLIRAAP